jgi:hypothetical protein
LIAIGDGGEALDEVVNYCGLKISGFASGICEIKPDSFTFN